MLTSDKEMQAQLTAFQAMLNSSASSHLEGARKAYAFDFVQGSSDVESEPSSPFTWTEEEANVEYYKTNVRLELKPRMCVSSLLHDKETSIKMQRLSESGPIGRFSIFSQTTSASTTLEDSFVSLYSGGLNVTRCFETFSSSEVKKAEDEGFSLSVA